MIISALKGANGTILIEAVFGKTVVMRGTSFVASEYLSS